MSTHALPWAIFGPPGLREVAIIVFVAFVLYGPPKWLGARRGGSIFRYLLPNRSRCPGQTQASGRSDPMFWFLTVLSATAIASWILARYLTGGRAD